jgi:serine/threonine protein kinase
MDYHNLCPGCMEEKGATKTCPYCGYEQGTTPASAHHLAPGTLLENKYLLGRVLGQGGFGITYIAWDRKLDMKLAIKEYFPQGMAARTPGRPEVDNSSGELKEQLTFGLQRFLNEAKTLARFAESPNIVTVRDYFEANGTAYLVMSYVEGVTLEQYLRTKGGRLSFNRCLEIIMPILDALKEVHKAGIMHRDISPDNIFINQDGRVILIDFGAARQEMREKSKSLSVILKAGYAPEEQYRSRGKQGPWTDIYAVAATMYRVLTGQIPLEAIDRLDEDDLAPPSQMGSAIEAKQEKVLLKALAVKGKDRYQTVEEFQSDLIAASVKEKVKESYAGVKPEKTAGFMAADKKRVEDDHKQKLKADMGETGRVPVKKPLPDQQPVDRDLGQETPYTISRKTVKIAVLIAACALLLFGSISFLGGGSRNISVESVAGDQGYQNEAEETANLAHPEEQQPTYNPAVIASLDADYYIDFDNGTIPIGDLPIGSRVVDPSWEWEYRLGIDYSDRDWDGDPTPPGEVKPVTWIVVDKDHYDGLEPHVTLLSEDLIGLHTFDNSTGRDHEYDEYGYNHWGESGTANATRGLRPWLNSSGIHSGEGFYRAFSERFKGAVLTTTVPNKEWKNGNPYITSDNVFIPSSTELGDEEHEWTYRIGDVYAYFFGAGDRERVALMVGDGWYANVEKVWGKEFMDQWGIYGNNWFYWTRSPDSYNGDFVRLVNGAGEFYTGTANYGLNANYGNPAVRPALNLKSEILVSEIRN